MSSKKATNHDVRAKVGCHNQPFIILSNVMLLTNGHDNRPDGNVFELGY